MTTIMVSLPDTISKASTFVAQMEREVLAHCYKIAVERDNRQTSAELGAIAHSEYYCSVTVGLNRFNGCMNHDAHNRWAYDKNQAMYARADARKAAQK